MFLGTSVCQSLRAVVSSVALQCVKPCDTGCVALVCLGERMEALHEETHV